MTPRRALVVEDGKTSARAASRVLASLGFSIEITRSETGARSSWRPGLFALFVVDVSIRKSETSDEPGNGLAFVSWARERGETAPMIAWSTDDGVDNRERAERAGATFVSKADGVEGLRRAIVDTLGTKGGGR